MGLGAVFVFLVLRDLELFDLDAIADGVGDGVDESVVLGGGNPALGDEGVVRRRELQRCLRALDLDAQLLLEAHEEAAVVEFDLLEVGVDPVEFVLEVAFLVGEFADVLLGTLFGLRDRVAGELDSDERIVDESVGRLTLRRCGDDRDDVAAGQDLVRADLVGRLEGRFDLGVGTLTDEDVDAVVPESRSGSIRVRRRVDAIDLLLDQT